MSELKTLKEIETDFEGDELKKAGTVEAYLKSAVRREAIKWLKKYHHPDKTTLPISAWLDFHNITEEELK